MKHTFLTAFCCAALSLGQALAQPASPYSEEAFGEGEQQLLYRKLLPQNFDPQESYPLVLFLHGAGERGSDNTRQLTHGSTLFTNPLSRDAFPAVVLMPQCPEDDYWAQVAIDRSSYPIGLEFHYEKGPTPSMQKVMALLEQYLAEPYTDPSRVYVVGLSMGGMGTFEILSRMPDTFAAAVPICGGGDPASVAAYAGKTALWIFHGGADQVVGPEHSLKMYQALFEAGERPGFTMYPKVNHNSWDYAFAEAELLPWLFSQKRVAP